MPVQDAVFKVEGQRELSGSITPQGAKNEALQVISAVLLTSEEVIIDNIPAILDVNMLLDLLRSLGLKVEQLGQNSYSFQAQEIDWSYFELPDYAAKVKRLRGSIMLMGSLLGRWGKATMFKPGGDKIGRRRLDTHFHGFQKLGVSFDYKAALGRFDLKAKHLKGNYIHLEEPSVTGTANIILTAVLAEGKTTIYNAACEPYVQQLCKMLNNMGAKIEGIGSNLLSIRGVAKLHGTRHTIQPDMIEIGSFIGLAATTQSALTVKDAYKADLTMILRAFEKLGIKTIRANADLHIPKQKRYKIGTFLDDSILTLYDGPWPMLTPDVLSVLLVTAIRSEGSVLIHQKMFESRLFFVDKLIDMGAKIVLCDPHRATVVGQGYHQNLKAISMTSPDIRAGIALLIAALAAEGTSYIYNVNQIDRGYQNIEQRLNALGASITRINLEK